MISQENFIKHISLKFILFWIFYDQFAELNSELSDQEHCIVIPYVLVKLCRFFPEDVINARDSV